MKVVKNKHGQTLKGKGLLTRQGLLVAASNMLNRDGFREPLSTSRIAQAAGISPGAFYLYFEGVHELLLELASDAYAEMGELVLLLSEPWRPERVLREVERFVAAFNEFWRKHHGVLNYSIYSANHGDPEFEQLRRSASFPVIKALARKMVALHGGEEIFDRNAAVARANLIWSGMQHMTASVFAATVLYPVSLANPLDHQTLLRAECDILVLAMTPKATPVNMETGRTG